MAITNFDAELNFTETYKKYNNENVAIREAMCLKTMFNDYFTNIEEGDVFAGRVSYGLVGFGLENTTGGSLYYCRIKKIQKLMEGIKLSEEYKSKVRAMITFWKEEVFIDQETSGEESSTFGKLIKSLPKEVLDGTSNRIANMGGRVAGAYINYDKLMKIGLPGLISQIKDYRKDAEGKGKNCSLHDGMLISLEALVDVCQRYASQGRELLQTSQNEEWKSELRKTVVALENICISRPKTLREGIQLMWLYALAAENVNYGRMDIYLGDLYASDLNKGLITEAKALELLQSLWRLIVARRIAANEIAEFNARVVIGGRGRRNEENADKIAILAMEASRTVIETEPQLTLRFYKGMNPDLMKKALNVIGEGRVYPMIYNDDVNIPAVEKAFNVTTLEAQQYLPYGCGEYTIDHIAVGSPNCSLNVVKALEVTLHNGKDPLTGKDLGLKTGELSEFNTFEKLFNAYKIQIEYYVQQLSKRHALEYKVENEMASFLLTSILYDNCIESGKSLVDGGPKYKGGIIESFGIVNTADSFTTIKELVYDKKVISLESLVKVLDTNYKGYEKEYKMILSTPKYGNDIDSADAMVEVVSDHLCTFTQNQAKNVGLDYFLIVNVNNYFNVEIGKITAASSDGRKSGTPFANGNTPTAGNDKNGVTAFLNSICKISPNKHAGYTHNMKFSKQMFNKERVKLEALLSTYFDKGGTQAMMTVVNKGDLEGAMIAPEKYSNLIVRVGGFSARYIELSKDIQLDILHRTLY
ncbi:MAG TPA: pyruvate formate lyase family protein [Clostridiaceae bacterium]